MRIRPIQILAAVAAITGALVPAQSGAVRPDGAGGDGSIIKPAWTPLGVGKQPVTVVMQLAADPVAVRQGNAGRKLERREKDDIKSQLRSSQVALHSHIRGMGGTVLANYQAAYNGIKVRIAADRVGQLAALPGVVAVRPLWPIKPDNIHGVPAVGAPAVWQSLGLHARAWAAGSRACPAAVPPACRCRENRSRRW